MRACVLNPAYTKYRDKYKIQHTQSTSIYKIQHTYRTSMCKNSVYKVLVCLQFPRSENVTRLFLKITSDQDWNGIFRLNILVLCKNDGNSKFPTSVGHLICHLKLRSFRNILVHVWNLKECLIYSWVLYSNLCRCFKQFDLLLKNSLRSN